MNEEDDHLMPWRIFVGARLRELRESRGYSLRKMADLCQTNFGRVGAIERGVWEVNMVTFLRYCEALAIHPKEFFSTMPDLKPRRKKRSAD